LAVLDFRRRIGWFEKRPDQTIEPFLELSALPADAPLPDDIYGYPAIRYIYGSENAARVAAWGAYQYYRRLPTGNTATSSSAPPDRPDPEEPVPGQPTDSPPERPPSSEPSPRSARISLDNRALDSVTIYEYQYGDSLCRSP
jgi:hypothetical protein